MSEYPRPLVSDIENLKERFYNDPIEVLDPEGVVHHEFVSGNHGRKLDIDKIHEGTDFYINLVSVYARTIRSVYSDRIPDALVGIANGANRFSRDIAPLLGKQVLGLMTTKIDQKTVHLDDQALKLIDPKKIKFALTVEDVGTTGSTTATAVANLRELGIRRIESFNIWQRNQTLAKLDAIRVPYHAVIFEPLPMFTKTDCESSPQGFCARGIPLIEHS